jgi:hypothetical protein
LKVYFFESVSFGSLQAEMNLQIQDESDGIVPNGWLESGRRRRSQRLLDEVVVQGRVRGRHLWIKQIK